MRRHPWTAVITRSGHSITFASSLRLNYELTESGLTPHNDLHSLPYKLLELHELLANADNTKQCKVAFPLLDRITLQLKFLTFVEK